MKKLFLLFLIITIKTNIVICQYHNADLVITNHSSTTSIRVTIYPISLMVNAYNNFDLAAKTRGTFNGHTSYYLNGVEYYNSNKLTNWVLPPNDVQYSGRIDFDIDNNGNEEEEEALFNGKLGYGVYKIIIQTIDPQEYPTHIDSVTLDFDLNSYVGDQWIHFYDYDEDPKILFQWHEDAPEFWVRINSTNYQIQPWVHYTRNRVHSHPTEGFPTYNTYNTAGSNIDLILPHDSKRDCNRVLVAPFNSAYQNQNQSLSDPRSGNLTLNLKLVRDTYTPVQSDKVNLPTFINIMKYDVPNYGIKKCIFEINTNVLFQVKYDSWYTSTNNRFISMNNYGDIVLRSQAQIWLENYNRLSLYDGSLLKLDANSSVRIWPYALFCNYGGTIQGPGRIYYSGKIRCAGGGQDFIMEDSAKIVLKDSASWELEPNSTITLEGNETALICEPGSQIKFGYNSKLILKNGARIFADSSIFTSLDSNNSWDGIYLSDLSYDTLKNCTIENALNGINIEDKYNPFASPSATEISSCTFRNTTDSNLINFIYMNNSSNILIRNCNSEITSDGKFLSGILAEYCPANGVVITDNNINYVTTGISLVQSSEYIARNTITGPSSSGTGIYLDNSNGTIEYNIVNNFLKSLTSYYSSPYLLKNTLSEASSKNIDLYSNSFPVMKPVVSGSTLRWLGGNNTVTGTPSTCGIAFADCYPLMDSGYNKVTVNGADYVNGTFTGGSFTTVYASLNYWYDNPPQSQLFDVSEGSVSYDPTFDGTSVPSTDGSELNSIGWGLYDTVFTKSLGDSPTAEDLFMQAYTEEMASDFNDAIDLYKEVVSEYKTSSYAPVSLSRIFNCLEKNNSTASQYQSIQSYYSNITGNSAYPLVARELAEDFVIKSKVKRGLLEEAISDYDYIYQHSTNSSKRLHALMNKLCLIRMASGRR